MAKNFLIVVEGAKTEKNILIDVLPKLGFNAIREDKINIKENIDVSKYTFEEGKNNVIVIQGSKNRIHDLLKEYNEKTDDFEKFIMNSSQIFTSIYILYDADHNSH